MDPMIEEIVEQVSLGIILRESKSDSTNRLGLICVDNAVEVTMKFYCSYNSLLKDSVLDSPAGFFSALDKIHDEGKISDKDWKDTKQFHKLRNDLYHRAKLTTIKGKVIDDYVKIAKTLLDHLHSYKANDLEWKKNVNEMKKALVKEKSELKEPVNYEAKHVNSDSLVLMKTAAKLQNTESIMLVTHGFITNYAKSPNKDELKKSLMISGRDISQGVLDTRLSDLRRTGYVEKKELKLKGKAFNRLRKKFLI